METIFEYTLKTPAIAGERTVTELKFHRPKTRDFLRTDGHQIDSVGADVALVSSLTGEPEAIVSAIDIDDWAVIRVEIQKIWYQFFGIKPTEESSKKAGAEAEKMTEKS